MTAFNNNVRRSQLADTTSGREGALMVGTDSKTHLGNSTTAEAAFTYLDSYVVTTDAAIDALEDAVGDINTALIGIDSDIDTINTILGTKGDLFGLNDFRHAPGDPFEIRSNYGLTVTRNGDIYFIDSHVETGDIPILAAGTGIDIDQVGSTFTISCTVTIPDPPTVSGGQGITVTVSGSDYKIHSRETRVVLTDGATVTLDCANDNRFILFMDSARPSRTLALSNMSDGQIVTLILVQGASAGNTVTWFANAKWPGDIEPTLSTGNGEADIFTFERYSSTKIIALVSGQGVTGL